MFSVSPLPTAQLTAIWHKVDNKTKPPGSLGQLEALACQIAQIQGGDPAQPLELNNPTLLVFAGDHGVCEEGVSPFPSEVTGQMVMNFLAGGAAINCFCREAGIQMQVIDAGIKADIPDHPQLCRQRIAAGTGNFAKTAAMSHDQARQALQLGAERVSAHQQQGCNVIGFGEMGIGNTSAAAALMAAFTGLPAEQCVGRGTGLDEAGVAHKATVIAGAVELHREAFADPVATLAALGGFEIAQMAGGMLRAAELGMLVLVDGFIASAAAMVACAIAPEAKDYLVFCHASNEQGHQAMLAHLDATPLLDLGLRLGEGTGAALAYPLVKAAVAFYNDMASFESAGVSGAD